MENGYRSYSTGDQGGWVGGKNYENSGKFSAKAAQNYASEEASQKNVIFQVFDPTNLGQPDHVISKTKSIIMKVNRFMLGGMNKLDTK